MWHSRADCSIIIVRALYEKLHWPAEEQFFEICNMPLWKLIVWVKWYMKCFIYIELVWRSNQLSYEATVAS